MKLYLKIILIFISFPVFAQKVPENLHKHSEEFKKEIIKVTDGVYCAIGYGIANTIFIEGKDSLIVIDVQDSNESAQAVKADFDKISKKPIKALIYTHNHSDHVAGCGGFVNENDVFDVYAHATTASLINQQMNLLRPIILKRSMRMFGSVLTTDEQHVNCGIGGKLNVDPHSTFTTYYRTKTFEENLKVTISGVDLELIHAPGETSDQIYVWLPKHKLLICGDNLYKAFPNLYTI